jgi:hypothetical protein
MKSEDKIWLASKEAKAKLKISDCQLMHLRMEEKIEFKKVGRSYFYIIIN